jgi:hypothetical protein
MGLHVFSPTSPTHAFDSERIDFEGCARECLTPCRCSAAFLFSWPWCCASTRSCLVPSRSGQSPMAVFLRLRLNVYAKPPAAPAYSQLHRRLLPPLSPSSGPSSSTTSPSTYILHHSNRALPGAYKFSALWSGQEGSLPPLGLAPRRLRLRPAPHATRRDVKLYAYASEQSSPPSRSSSSGWSSTSSAPPFALCQRPRRASRRQRPQSPPPVSPRWSSTRPCSTSATSASPSPSPLPSARS